MSESKGKPAACAFDGGADVGDEDEDAGDQGNGDRRERDLVFAGGEFLEIEMADGEEGDQGEGGVEKMFCAAVGPVPGEVFSDVHGRRLDHEDAEAEEAEDADGEDVLETETVD